jgi:preprotein translocase subunit SecA
MKARLKDFPIDHRLMTVADTPKMAAIAQQIAALQAEYDKLRDDEQRRQFAAFLRTVRENASERTVKDWVPAV